MVIKLKYGNTNTFFLSGEKGSLLIDTDYAGTMPAFYREIKKHGVSINDIGYILATHYHPDHIGLVSELTDMGIKLLLMDVQRPYVHFADEIFARERKLEYKPIREEKALCISCDESRAFLGSLGICAEIISTPSHSSDSISLIMDDGTCFIGDLEPAEYLGAYENNTALGEDWRRILDFNPKIIYYAHANEKRM